MCNSLLSAFKAVITQKMSPALTTCNLIRLRKVEHSHMEQVQFAELSLKVRFQGNLF
jgi:hypothetical protein